MRLIQKTWCSLFRVIESVEDGESIKRTARLIKTDINIPCSDEIKQDKSEIRRYLKVIYCVIERLTGYGTLFTIDDVVSDTKKALIGDPLLIDVIERSKSDFPIRTDVAIIGNIFKGYFNIEYSTKVLDNPNSLLYYMFYKVQQLKTKGHQSFSRSFRSTRASLEKYLNGYGY